MRIDPGLSLLEVAPGVLQVGSGERSVQLSGCSPMSARYLRRLADGVPDGSESAVAGECGLDPARARDLEGLLATVLRRHDPQSERPGHGADLLAQDLDAALALDGDSGGNSGVDSHGVRDARHRHAELMRRRQGAQVQVLGLGRTGAAVVHVLAAAGIGHLAVWDRLPVAAEDLGSGYLTPDLGRSRPIALSRRVEGIGPGSAVLPLTHPDRPGPGGLLTVQVTRGAVDADFLALARTAEHPVLPLVLRDDDVLVGPWSVPGTPGCPLCWELAAAEVDPHRTERSTGLLRAAAGREEIALATAAGALASRQVIRWVEASDVPHGVLVRIRGDGGSVSTVPVPAHPQCTCSALSAGMDPGVPPVAAPQAVGVPLMSSSRPSP